MTSRLTAAQAERLAMLAEEAGEIVQACTKILRHGYESYHPKDLFNGQPKPGAESNRTKLSRELRDLAAVFEIMTDAGDICEPESDIRPIIDRKLSYTHHQNERKG